MQLQFGEFSIDSNRRELSERGTSIHLTPKAFDLLSLLIAERSKVLSKKEIYSAIWPGTFVDESNLSVLVAEVRKALHDESRQPRFIKTVHRIGYVFIGEARHGPSQIVPIRIRSASKDYDLVEGENIVGRDVEARIRINAPGISRHHARIFVAGDRATIEDLGSKNGTYVEGLRIENARELHDGDEIRLSREVLTVLMAERGGSTVTDIA